MPFIFKINILSSNIFSLYFLCILLILNFAHANQQQFWWNQQNRTISQMIQENVNLTSTHANFTDISFKYHLSCKSEIFQCKSYLGQQVFDKILKNHIYQIENIYSVYSAYEIIKKSMEDGILKFNMKQNPKKLISKLVALTKFDPYSIAYSVLMNGIRIVYDYIKYSHVQSKCQQLTKQIQIKLQNQLKQYKLRQENIKKQQIQKEKQRKINQERQKKEKAELQRQKKINQDRIKKQKAEQQRQRKINQERVKKQKAELQRQNKINQERINKQKAELQRQKKINQERVKKQKAELAKQRQMRQQILKKEKQQLQQKIKNLQKQKKKNEESLVQSMLDHFIQYF